MCYCLLEVLSTTMVWLMGPFSWLLLRCGFTYLMLSKKVMLAAKVLSLMKRPDGLEEEVVRRKAELFQKW